MQLLEELRLATLPHDCAEVLNSEFMPLHLEGFISFDEKHLKQQVGIHTKIERRVKRDQFGVPSATGSLPPKRKKVALKYEQEARAMFGCFLYRDENNQLVGGKADVFDYSGRLVVGVKNYNKAVDEELAEKRNRKKGKRETVWTRGVGGYEGRYGADNARREAQKVVNKKFCCATELIDHIHRCAEAAFKGTPYEKTYRVYHDHLSAMWESGAIAYMKEIGLFNRLIIIRGSNNALVVPRYQNSLPGNSPEHARGTDSHCFSDLMTIISANGSLTESYCNDDPRKFSRATPKSCMSAMSRGWSIVPSQRIVQDFLDWPRVIQKIVDAKGTKVEGECIRSGKRYVRTTHDGKEKVLKRKPKNRDCKSTLQSIPVHPDAEEGLQQILSFGKSRKTILKELLEAQAEENDQESGEECSDAGDEDDMSCEYLSVVCACLYVKFSR